VVSAQHAAISAQQVINRKEHEGRKEISALSAWSLRFASFAVNVLF